MVSLKRTPLFPVYHKQATCIDFAGWELPVQFSKIQEEHEAVRERAGLFDVSHMGEIEVSGKGAVSLLQRITTNDVERLSVHQVQYTTMCREDGGTIDDLLIYRLDEDRYLLVVNAANTDKDEEWINQHATGDVRIQNRSDQFVLMALQGPLAEAILQPYVDLDLSKVAPFRFEQAVQLFGASTLISRTGYTGEDGFELYLSPHKATDVWLRLLDVGRKEGLLPCGLGARDTLRFEAGFPLYGQELTESITPIEAGMDFVVITDKRSYIGDNVLIRQKQAGAPRKLVGMEMIERGIPRSGYSVLIEGVKVGHVTTGTRSPTLQKNLALALIRSEYARRSQEVMIDLRGKKRKAKIVPIPFYRRG